jgi:hypothetical protein
VTTSAGEREEERDTYFYLSTLRMEEIDPQVGALIAKEV